MIKKESKNITPNTVSSDCLALVGSRSKPFYSVNDSLRNGQTHQTQTVSEVEQSDSFIRDSMLEQSTVDDKAERKRGDEKVKNRLAQIAREKLGVVSKQKQLQLERKKRAMAFLNQITGKCKFIVNSFIPKFYTHFFQILQHRQMMGIELIAGKLLMDLIKATAVIQ